MKKIYFTILAVLNLVMVNAQNRLFEDFDASLTPPGWTNPQNQGGLISRVTNVQSFGRAGVSASVMCDGYNITSGARALLESPTFLATTSADSLRFDVAAAAYPSYPGDSLIVHAFTGTSFVRVVGWASEQSINLAGITTASALAGPFTPTNAQWLEKVISLPVGTTRIRFEFYSGYSNRIYIDHVRIVGQMSYQSSTTSQNNTNSVSLGATNQEIIAVQVEVSGSLNPLVLSNFNFTTFGSTNPSLDIDSAKVFYTGTLSTFSTANRLGAVANPNGNFSIPVSQTLQNGINYFWLAYDIKATATLTNQVDAACNSITVGGIPRTPTVQSPTGSRTISSSPVQVAASAGTSTGSYNTLKEAFDNINSGVHQGNILISTNGIINETATALLRKSGVGLTNYTKVVIKPTGTTTIQGNIQGAIIHLRGSENVTIDGKIGVDPENKITIINNNLLANSAVIQLSTLGIANGAKFDTIMHCNIYAGRHDGAINTFGIYMADSTILNTGTGAGNNYNAFVNNNIGRCRYGIYNRGATTLANHNKSVFISGNHIGSEDPLFNVSFVGIDCQQQDSLFIQDNIITDMFEATTQVIVRAIDLGANIVNSVIQRNYINNIRHTSNALFRSGQGIFLNTVAASNNSIINNVILNLNGHGSAAFANNAWGILVNAGGGINIWFNTIALSGTSTTTGSADRSGCLLLNSSASTAINVRGNIFFNTRQPGNNVNGFSMCVNSVATNTNVVYNNNIYHVAPANVRFITGVIGGIDRANFAAWQTGTTQDGASSDANPQLATTGLGRGRIAPTSPAVAAGPGGTGVTSDITGATRSITTPTMGAYENGFVFADLQPTNIYTLGKLPIPYANPHVMRARIFNLGNAPSTGSKAYFSITGANTHLDSLVLPTIAPGQSVTVDMPAFSYLNTGVDTVEIFVEQDSNNVNNSVQLVQIINTNTYSYAEPFRPADGGVGFNGGTGDFVAKFPYTGSNSINQIGVNFNTGGQLLSVGIWDTASTGAPGANIWTSAPFNSVTGLNTIVVNPPVPINGSFFVGVRQIGTVNAAFSYQIENPIRPQTFYFTAPTGGTVWNDFAPNNPFRFMIEPRLQEADDVGATNVLQPCVSVIQGSSPIFPVVEIFNYGALGQSNFIVKSEITGPVNFTSTDTFQGFLFSSEAAALVLNNSFNPTTAGVYTMKVWTELTGDFQLGNDTFTYQFEVTNPNFATDGGNQLTLDGITQYGIVNGSGSLNISGDQLTIEAWVYLNSLGNRVIVAKDSTANISQYKLYVNATGNLIFKFTTFVGVDSIVSTQTITAMNYHHVAVSYDNMLGFVRLYINGELAAQQIVSGGLIPTVKPVYVGRDIVAGGLAGRLEEVRIWDTARTDVQIRSAMHTRLANAAHPNLKAYWRMDEPFGTTTIDASGNCNSLLLAGNPLFNASTIPLGTPVVATGTVNTSGVLNLPTAALDIDVFNQLGGTDFYVHRFIGTPFGTSPTIAPATVTAVTPNNWVMYRYGTGTMDSALVTFNVSGINASPNLNDFTLFRRGVGESGGWFIFTNPTAVNFTNQSVTARFLSANFGNQITIGANNNPLPVSLLYFNARNNSSDVFLKWATANELDNKGFEIQRSANGVDFEKVDFVSGMGRSIQTTTYDYVDSRAFALAGSNTLYYRLIQRDFSGKETVSEVAVVNLLHAKDNLVSVYPNPFAAQVNIDLDVLAEGVVTVHITDVTGAIIYTTQKPVLAGYTSLNISELQNASAGIYFVRTTINGESKVFKLVKQ